MIDRKVGTDTDIELRQRSKVGRFSDAKQCLLFSGTVDIELTKGFRVDGFADAERCPLSLGRIEGKTGHGVGTAVDIELQKVGRFVDALLFREEFPVDIELK